MRSISKHSQEFLSLFLASNFSFLELVWRFDATKDFKVSKFSMTLSISSISFFEWITTLITTCLRHGRQKRGAGALAP